MIKIEEQETTPANNIKSPKCPSCGGTVVFKPEAQCLQCEYCGYNEELCQNPTIISETDLGTFNGLQENLSLESFDKKVYHCKSCGVSIFIDKDQLKSKCSYCASEDIHLESFEHRTHQPNGIIPFYLGKKEAEFKFGTWIGQGWFHPSSLKKAATLESLNGIYIPFWTFDFHVEADWSGEAGYHYTSYERVFVQGKWVNQAVTKIRWEFKSGVLKHFIDDLLVAGSDKIEPKYRSRISGYRLNEMMSFDYRYMMGWQSELYNQDLKTSYGLAEQLVLEQVRQMCSGQLGGNIQRNLRVNTQLSRQTFKQVYLPLWLSTYKYQGKIYRILINGQTGKVYGEKPISWIKISLLILLFLLLILTIYLLKEYRILQNL